MKDLNNRDRKSVGMKHYSYFSNINTMQLLSIPMMKHNVIIIVVVMIMITLTTTTLAFTITQPIGSCCCSGSTSNIIPDWDRMVRSDTYNYRMNRNILLHSTTPTDTTTTSTTSNTEFNIHNSNHHPIPECPKISPATKLPNQFYHWKKKHYIRYQTTTASSSTSTSPTNTETNDPPTIVLLIHGLFTNSDHWRNALNYFSSYDNSIENDKNNDVIVYAIDLLGCGYSDTPINVNVQEPPYNGEIRRFGITTTSSANSNNSNTVGVLPNVILGTATGQVRSTPINIELLHPTNSSYNFYTWADLIADFCTDIIIPTTTTTAKVTLVCNSIGTISSLQAVLDHPKLFNGVFVVSPNFRELHSAEVPYPSITMPIVRFQQYLLRNVFGQSLFNTLAKPSIVRDILRVPYANQSAVDDELVQVLLDPLLRPGASTVVFDTLSYSAGPLPEPQLQQLSDLCAGSNNNNNDNDISVPIWVCYGTKDPWTPSLRVDALQNIPIVERVIPLPDIGHCPHDEAPDMVHTLLLEFIQQIKSKKNRK